MAKIGFVGLGNMGFHMAKNIVKAGEKLVVYDISRGPMKALQDLGAETAESPAKLADRCSEIITMLPTKVEVKKAFCDDNGILQKISKETLCLDCSTVEQEFALEMDNELREKGAYYIDAPVSGGIFGAQNGTLTFMVGGDKGLFKRAEKILRCMGKETFHCGSTGSGQSSKICNNMLLAIEMIGISEALNLGIRLGLDPALLSAVINRSTGRCFASEVNNPVPNVVHNAPASNNYDGGFKCHLIAKDLKLAQNAATTTKSPIPLGSAAHQIYRLLANSTKYQAKDFSSVYKFLNEDF